MITENEYTSALLFTLTQSTFRKRGTYFGGELYYMVNNSLLLDLRMQTDFLHMVMLHNSHINDGVGINEYLNVLKVS